MERGPLKRIQAQVGLAHLLLELSFEEANAGTSLLSQKYVA
jgi:hypothetical protein